MTNNTEPIIKKSTYNMRNAIVNYYLLFMFAVFELILTDQYANARTDKYILFVVLTCALVVVVGAISLSYTADKNAPVESRVIEHKPIFSLSVTDVAFLLFFLFAVISTVISNHKLDSLTGARGRNNGLILLALYIGMYFIVSRFYYYKEYVMVAFLASSCIVAGLAVVNYFYIDPIGIFVGYGKDVIDDFGSTIGNKNTIASYMCVFLPIALAMFTLYKKRYIKILSAVSIGFAYTGMLVADSNSGYLGLMFIVFFMLLIFVRKPNTLKSFMLALTIMFVSGKLLRLFSFVMGDKSKGFEKIAEFLIYNAWSYVPIAVTAVLYGIMCIVTKREIKLWHKNLLTGGLLAIGLAIIGVCIYIFIYYTFVDTTTKIGALSQWFRFDDRWGTHRGFMWINGIKDYLKFDAMHLLFGSGCDTFYYVFQPHFLELSVRFGNSSTDCIHSEYLNYLVTQGALGLASYMTLLISTVVRALKKSKSNPLVLVFVCPVVCYCVQAVVNIYQPITTPFLFIFIAMCECVSRESNPVNKLINN